MPKETVTPTWLTAGRIPSLDGLRAVAIVGVLICHVTKTHGISLSPRMHAAMDLAGIGVDIFFVISGFLITTLMLREMSRTSRLDVKAFYFRRVLRIVPAYLCFLVVVAALDLAGLAHLTSKEWLASLTYTVNFLPKPVWEIGHVWSLSIEEHFYLLWPLVMAAGGAVVGRRAAIGIIITCFVIRWYILLFQPHQSSMASMWTFTRLDTIAFGCLLALLSQESAWRERLDRFSSIKWIVAAGIALVGSLLLSMRSGKFLVGIAYTANALLIAILLWALVRRENSFAGRSLNHRFIAAIGVGSYSLYLWQQIFLNPHHTGFIYRFPQNLLFVVIAAVLSYHLVEKPFLSLKNRSKAGEPRPQMAIDAIAISS